MRSADITRRVAQLRTLAGRLWRPFFICLLALACAPMPMLGAGGGAAHVVIVSIDGLRPDAISLRTTPNLTQALGRAVYSLRAQTVSPSSTLPAHISMLTGLDVPRHGVRWNHYVPRHYAGDTVFTLAERAGYATAMVYAKTKLAYLAPAAGTDFAHGPATEIDAMPASALVSALTNAWSARPYGLSFIHLREPDAAGHAHGWMGPAYLQAVAEVDRALGRLLSALERDPRSAATAVIITADHGGRGRGHGSPAPENMTIPWIVLTPGHTTATRIERTVRVYDTAPTVLALLGVEPPSGLDGRAVAEVLSGGRPPR